MRVAVLVAVLVYSLTACTSSRPPARPAADVAGHSIGWNELQHNVTYALHFFSWARTADAPSTGSSCAVRSPVGWCRRLRDQVLARMIQEEVVLRWARAHHVVLRPQDSYRVEVEAAGIASDPHTSDVLGKGVTVQFLKQVLTREMMVRRVEEAVSPRVARVGPSVQVTKYIIPRLTGKLGNTIYRQAVDLATDGRPIPLGARANTTWVARFRLSPSERSALSAASIGDFIGPFSERGAYLVMRILRRGTHRYGSPARTELETRYFRPWLAGMMRRTRVTCYTPGSQATRCPVQSIKSE